MADTTNEMTDDQSTRAIRRDIQRTERDMSETIDEIEHRLSPAHLKQQAKDSIRRTSVRTSQGLMGKVKSNPIGAAMIGVGVWMLMRDHNDGGEYDSMYERDAYARNYQAYGYGYSNRGRTSGMHDRLEHASDAMDTVKDRASELVGDAGERADEFRRMAARRAQMARYDAQDFLTESPLLAGLAAAAVGAILGSLIPATEREQELMGSTRDRLADRAKDLAREGVDRAKEAASAATHAATSAAKETVRKDDVATDLGIGR